MTQYLCEAAKQVVAVEIDKMLIPILKDTLYEYDNVEVINEDVLKVDIKSLAEEKNGGKPIKVVANLPYYITTPIIMGLFESKVPIDSITTVSYTHLPITEAENIIQECILFQLMYQWEKMWEPLLMEDIPRHR